LQNVLFLKERKLKNAIFDERRARKTAKNAALCIPEKGLLQKGERMKM